MSYFSGRWREWEKRTDDVEAFCHKMGEFTLFDLGSAGGTPPPFVHLLPHIKVINFEPDPRSESEPNTLAIPAAIGPSQLKQVYLNKRPTTSSLLPPNKVVTGRYDFEKIFPGAGDIFETVRIEPVDTVGLDDAVEHYDLPYADFLKIDVQGLTLEVLESGCMVLKNAVGLTAELEFIPSYKGQACFDETHRFLVGQGFELFKLSNICKWFYKTKITTKTKGGQQTFCDMLYMRSIDSIQKASSWTKDMASKQILVLLLFDMPDAAAAYYERYVKHNILAPDDQLVALITEWAGVEQMFYNIPHVPDTKSRETMFLTSLLRRTWSSLRQTTDAVYLFGGGQHSAWLLKELQDAPGPRIIGIIDENRKTSEIAGVPLLLPAAVAPQHPIILSTDVHQALFSTRCKLLFGEQVKTIDLYEGCPPGPYDKN